MNTATTKLKLYVWRNGLVEIGNAVPEKAFYVGTGTGEQLQSCLLLCRLMKDGSGRFLCNGVPEAENDKQAAMAVERFKHCVTNKLAGRKAFDGLEELMAKQEFDGYSYATA